MMEIRRIGALSGVMMAITLLVGMALSLGSPAELKSGVEKGGTLVPFHPTHVTGADKGTRTCPV